MQRNKYQNRSASRGFTKPNFQRKNNNTPLVRPAANSMTSSSNVKNRKHEVTKPMNYKTLENVLKTVDDAELILNLSVEMNGFLLLLDQKDIRPDLMCKILAALAQVSDCSAEEQTVHLLVQFYIKIIPKLNGNFQRELVMYSANLRNHVDAHSPQRQNHVEAVQNLLKFVRRLQLTLYQKSFDIVNKIVHQFASQIEYINRKGNVLNDEIVELLAELKDSMQNLERMKAETEKHEVLLEPPNNYRDISIYPKTDDILHNHEPFIRQNVVDGKYVGGIDHYLDTQFRLLREDFMKPLRDGISEYVRLKNKTKALEMSNFRIKDLNVYQNVKIVSSKMIHNEQVYTCTFDIRPFKNLRWQYNKRMISGSLMCLSSNDFKSFCFATVYGQRDPVKLANGEFQIKLEVEHGSMPEITPLIIYVMVESQVYFEAYRHNLKVLQEFGKDNFPLERYIVDLNMEMVPPSYLTENTVYEISNGQSGEDSKKLTVPILRKEGWPPSIDFNLDEFQFEAFRAALTNQLVLIQGPPGTGKTYIGLRVVQTLLANRTSDEFPILIVCYTNHALDQFLGGIANFCKQDELIRIGGKSEMETMQKYNLSNIRAEKRKHRQVPQYIHNSRTESTVQLKLYQDEISRLEQNVNDLKKRFFGFELQKVMMDCNPKHLHQLRRYQNVNLIKSILAWLGCEVEDNNDENTNVNAIQHNNDIDTQNLVERVFDEQQLADAEVDEEEINEIERNRIIDNDWYDDAEELYLKRREELRKEPMEHRIDHNNIVAMKFEDLDGFQKVKRKRNLLRNKFKHEITKTETMSRERAKMVNNIYSLSSNERWNLYRLWIKLYTEELIGKIKEYRDLYMNEYQKYNIIFNQEDIELVRKAKIIGMTTTGAAKYRHIIAGVKPKITIVEEAAEVLEAHIVTALCQQTDHLILIGDHMQLKPNPAVYELAKKFNLEISLFERLIRNGLKYYQLKQQHRMRPCISSLLVPHFYKQLHDHQSVNQYDDVKGIAKNMFFIKHQKNETSQEETRSHMNLHEATFIVELCRYIILQGYNPSQVTILTTYSGQLHRIRQLMSEQFLLSGVRATVIDNYQGEENDIILLSFVRSNEESKIGFLKTSNRVNVALSRAKKGLYCIGNFDCLAEKCRLWSDLMQILVTQEAIGNELAIYCQNHPEDKTFVSSNGDFSSRPDGGCMRPCGSRLLCGHVCPNVCHIVDPEHIGIYKKCPKKCDKIICNNEHRCGKVCHVDKECGDCKVMIEKIREECGHSIMVECFSNPSDAYCPHPCERNRSCGHKCEGPCGKLCNETECNVMIKAKSPCDHTVDIKCSNANDKWKLLDSCNKTCETILKCGHRCKGSCGQCKFGRLHISCTEQCTRELICGHSCSGTCSVDCPPCKKKCTERCIHSYCTLRCGEPCLPCMEKCAWRCKHLKCSKLCSEPCDRQICEHPNEKKLRKCGHRSIGICGEKMPRLCRVCDKDEVEEICLLLGAEDDEDARFIELFDCKHVIEVDGLLRWMNFKPDGDNRSSIQMKKCPRCSTVIRNTKALNTFIQASLKDVQQVKLVAYGNSDENRDLQRRLNKKVNDILNKGLFKTKVVHLSKIYAEIFHRTKFDEEMFRPLPKRLLIELDNKFRLVERLYQICTYFKRANKMETNATANIKNICDNAVVKFEERIQMAADFIKDYRNSEQKRHDIETEISFLQMISKVIVEASFKTFKDNAKKLLDDAFELAHKNGSATGSIQNEFMELVNAAFKEATGLGISIDEQKMVLQAMSLAHGHWYKCPNGHIYCITECGGAMEKSTCPDCNEIIGGTNHSLVSSNSLASEMDGATGPAWPTNLMQQLHPFMD